MQAAKLREDRLVLHSFSPADSQALDESRWSRRSRFLFIASAATLCWIVPGLVVYLLVTPH